jgi:hypothetical protein
MAAQILTVVCAWCHRVVTPGAPTAGVTHTICPSCVDWTMACRANPDTFFERMAGLGKLCPPPGYFGDRN